MWGRSHTSSHTRMAAGAQRGVTVRKAVELCRTEWGLGASAASTAGRPAAPANRPNKNQGPHCSMLSRGHLSSWAPRLRGGARSQGRAQKRRQREPGVQPPSAARPCTRQAPAAAAAPEPPALHELAVDHEGANCGKKHGGALQHGARTMRSWQLHSRPKCGWNLAAHRAHPPSYPPAHHTRPSRGKTIMLIGHQPHQNMFKARLCSLAQHGTACGWAQRRASAGWGAPGQAARVLHRKAGSHACSQPPHLSCGPRNSVATQAAKPTAVTLRRAGAAVCGGTWLRARCGDLTRTAPLATTRCAAGRAAGAGR